jgi:hypothetical protein
MYVLSDRNTVYEAKIGCMYNPGEPKSKHQWGQALSEPTPLMRGLLTLRLREGEGRVVLLDAITPVDGEANLVDALVVLRGGLLEGALELEDVGDVEHTLLRLGDEVGVTDSDEGGDALGGCDLNRRRLVHVNVLRVDDFALTVEVWRAGVEQVDGEHG